MATKIFTLSDSELKGALKCVNELKGLIPWYAEELVFKHADVIAQELPRRIRSIFSDFSRETSDAIILKTGDFFANDATPTPQHYEELGEHYQYNDAQIFHALNSSLLGTPVGFDSQRSGRRLNNIIPTKDCENIPNSSSGSTHNFGFHTEDAFHEFRGDYLGLVCMRNDEKATTSYVSSREIPCDSELKTELFKEAFFIGHNHIHKIDGHTQPPLTSVLFGKPECPYMRINACNTKGIDDTAQKALNKFVELMANSRQTHVLERGDFFFLDNFYTAHARDAYKPNYGPKARWLSRFIIAKDLRKSKVARPYQNSYIIANGYSQKVHA
jgi:L-asparagine oxygenase